MRVVYGQDEAVGIYVASKIPQMHGDKFSNFVGLAVVDSKDHPVAGVVFDQYKPEYSTIQCHFAIERPVLTNKNIIKEVFDYPFNEVGVQKVWSAAPHKNERAIKFTKGIGFTQEAVLARHFGDQHAVICRLFKKDYERIYG